MIPTNRTELPLFSKDAMIFLPMGKLWGISWGIDRGIAREQWGINGYSFPIFLVENRTITHINQ
jgi:hypothetical protein